MIPELKTILFATDVGPVGPPVFRYAMMLAKCHNARMVVVSVLEPLGAFGESLVDSYVSKEELARLRAEGLSNLKSEIHQALDEVCRAEFPDGAACMERIAEIRVRPGAAADTILKEAHAVGADVIVMGSHGHTAVGEMLLGSVAHKVTQRSPVPVLLVPVRAS